MLNNLRGITRQSWRQRGKVYGLAVLGLTLTMTVFGAGPTRDADDSAAVWLAFAGGVLALVQRALHPDGQQQRDAYDERFSVGEQGDDGLLGANPNLRHEHDLASRNLNARLW